MANRGKSDYYADLARKDGYPARSVYKLKEIQEKFRVLNKGDRILDIGAAPGSWSMYAYRTAAKSGRVVGVDLNAVNLGAGYDRYQFFEGDAFSTDIRGRLSAAGPYDVVISDAAPKTTGNRLVDTSRSAELVHEVIALAVDVLEADGNLVAKLFQGGDEREILELLNSHFTTARFFKPKASRNESFETFAIAIGFQSR